MTAPVEKGIEPVANEATATATSSGSPHRAIGESPRSISPPYLSRTLAVISVRISPGLTSNTRIPQLARRTAKSLLAIDRADFEMQYSDFSVDTITALDEVIVIIDRRTSGDTPWAKTFRANAWVKKK